MNRRIRPQIGRRGVFVGLALIAITIVGVRWLRTDTIFYAESTSVLQLPDGQTLTTNRWMTRNDNLDLVLLTTDQRNEYFIIQDYDNTKVAMLQIGDKEFEAVVTDYRVRGPNYRGEYWLRPGKPVRSDPARQGR